MRKRRTGVQKAVEALLRITIYAMITLLIASVLDDAIHWMDWAPDQRFVFCGFGGLLIYMAFGSILKMSKD